MASPVIVITGPPGAGKGTQSKLLAERLKAAHISSGQLLREDNNPEILAEMAAGELAPSDYVEDLVEERIAKVSTDQAIVLDGFPRTMDDVEALNELLPQLERKLSHFIVLMVDKEESISRNLARGRADDTREALEERWDEYQEQTEKVIAGYRDSGKLVEIDGDGSIEEVAKRIEAIV